MQRSNKSSVIWILALGFLAMAAGLLLSDEFAAGIKKAEERKPNIIFILADDLGYGDVQAYNPSGKIATPHIDQLAQEGMRFTDAHSGTAVCSPTRYGALTGRHFSRQQWWSVIFWDRASLIPDDQLTVAEFLRQEGYHTGAFGKWHLGQVFYNSKGEPTKLNPDVDWTRPMSDGPNDRGFDEFFGVAGTHAHGLRALISNRLVTEAPTIISEKGYPSAAGYKPRHAMPAITQNAIDYIDWNASERPGEPFFLYYAPPAVHMPLTPSPEFVGTSEVGLYGDFVMQVDAAVGKIMAKLDEHGLRDDTLIIFTSDNGSGGYAGNGKHSHFHPMSVITRYDHKSNGDWRGYKGTVFEGGHRVPFIASWPGKIAPATVSEQLITLEDIMATTAAILGKELPQGTAEDSYDILPYLDGTHSGPPIREYAVLLSFNGDPIFRKGKWVLTFQLGSGAQFQKNDVPEPDGPKGQLYDLESDPQQEKNVWLDHPDVVAELTALYKEHVARGSSLGIDR